MKTPRKIAVVGPLPPVRSGIARHTCAIARALAARQDLSVKVWSFTRQYPKFLYPGEAETDDSLAAPIDLDIRNTIDGVNPLSWSRTAGEINEFAPDLLVIPAWTFFLAPALGRIASLVRQTGAQCCTVVHNAFDHEASAWKEKLSLWQLAKTDRFVTHNDGLAKELSQNFPETRIDVFPHPVFDDLPQPIGTLTREAKLELLFFGLIRPYKGLDLALEAVAKSNRKDLRLTVAGEFWQGLEETKELISKLGIANQIELMARYIDDQEAAELFHRADAIVLPYRSVTGSGVVATTYHYGRPVLATNLPGLAAVIESGKTGWLTPPADTDAMAKVIAGLDRETATKAGDAAREFGKQLSWSSFTDVILGKPSTWSANS